MHAISASQLQHQDLPGRSSVIRMADSPDLLVPIKDRQNVVELLDLIFNDAGESYGQVRPPAEVDARLILDFFAASTAPHFVAQCQAGVGRSQAVIAALAKIKGTDDTSIISKGTYNRRLYGLLLRAAGLELPAGPLVSIAVRVKYAPDRLNLFLLSMLRQRHPEWEVVAVTDGPNPDARKLVENVSDRRVRLIETERPLGRWGHPYRQLGLDACRGEFIGLSNDDNYYVPGYLEQMIAALTANQADVAACQMLHSYYGWDLVVSHGFDLGSWIAHRDLVRQTAWPANLEWDSDSQYFRGLCDKAKKVVVIKRASFVHN